MSQTLIPYDALGKKGITLSKTQLWRLEKANRFPRRVPISAARHGWVESEINSWLADRIASRAAAIAA